MASEIGEQALRVIWHTGEVSLTALFSMIKRVLENKEPIKHGKQSLKKLNRQNQKLETVSVDKEDLKAFKRELQRHCVDFSIKKEREGVYHAYFKSRDLERIYSGLEKCVHDYTIGKRRPLHEIVIEAEKKATAFKNKEYAWEIGEKHTNREQAR